MIKDIINRLQYSYDSFEKIGSDYNIEARDVAKINKGYIYKQDNIQYPIRNYKNISGEQKLTYDQVTEIINLLLNTDISISKIAKQYNVEVNIIIGIKSGNTKIYRRDGYTYPLRKK